LSASNISAGTLAVAYGGTGLTSTPANGALDIGNGTGFTRTTLTAGTGVTITNTSGSITIAATSTGVTISDDTSTNATRYPLFAAATSGTASTIYTSSTKYQYNPSTGDLVSPQTVASNGLQLNASTVNASYTISSGYNAMSVGPVTVASGKSVTVTSGQRWVVL
jgi:hypothetical protein